MLAACWVMGEKMRSTASSGVRDGEPGLGWSRGLWGGERCGLGEPHSQKDPLVECFGLEAIANRTAFVLR